MPHTNAWDNNRPADGDKIKQADDELRRLRLDIHDRLSDIFSNWPDGDPLTLANAVVSVASLAPAVANLFGKYYGGEEADPGALVGANSLYTIAIDIGLEGPWPTYYQMSFGVDVQFIGDERKMSYLLAKLADGGAGLPAQAVLIIYNPTAGNIVLNARSYRVLVHAPDATAVLLP